MNLRFLMVDKYLNIVHLSTSWNFSLKYWVLSCVLFCLEQGWCFASLKGRCLQCFDTVGRQEGHPACKNWVLGYWHCYLSGRGADLHMAQLMPLPLTVSCSSKSQFVLPFSYQLTCCAFSALTLLVGWQERHLACKKLSVGLVVWFVWGEVHTNIEFEVMILTRLQSRDYKGSTPTLLWTEYPRESIWT